MIGGINMSAVTTRERAHVDRAVEIFSKVEGEIRDIVRRDAAAPRHRLEGWTDSTPGHIAALLQRVSGDSVQEIDNFIAELRTVRDNLQNEARRVQSEISRYASLQEAARASIRTIAESLAFQKKA
jgi:hypothetical protein